MAEGLTREQRTRKRRERAIRVALMVTGVALLLVLILLLFFYFETRDALAEGKFARATAQTQDAAAELGEIFALATAVSTDLARDLSSGAVSYDTLEARLREDFEAFPSIQSAFVVQGTEPEQTWLHVFRTADGALQVEVGVPPAGSIPSGDWYAAALAGSSSYTEPFLDAQSGEALIGAASPFTLPSAERPSGAVVINYKLDAMRTRVSELDLGVTGFGIVFNENGTYLSHPVPEYVVVGNVFEDEFVQDQIYRDAAEQALAGESPAVERVTPVADESVWNFFTPIPGTNWVLVVQLFQLEFAREAALLLQGQIAILLAAAALLFVLVLIVARVEQGATRQLWTASAAFTLIGLTVIVTTIVLSRNVLSPLSEGALISSTAALNAYLDDLRTKYDDRVLLPLVEIPTGLLVQAMRFPDPTTLTFNGYVWQRAPRDVASGITLPQTIDEPFMLEELHREERADETYVLWNVTSALRQTFNPERYPLDRYDIRIRLLPTEFARNALLVPDLEAYDVTTPGLEPGLDDAVAIPQWDVMASGFAFMQRRYNTDLGLNGRATINVPELTFNVRVQRRFLGPFIAFFLPALVAAVMIFGFLLNDQKPDEPEEIVTALSYTAALFFVIAVLHAALRDSAAAVGLTYLEYFYLMLYVITLLVAANSFFVVRYPSMPLVAFRNNLIAKLLYWPVFVAVMLVVTLNLFVGW